MIKCFNKYLSGVRRILRCIYLLFSCLFPCISCICGEMDDQISSVRQIRTYSADGEYISSRTYEYSETEPDRKVKCILWTKNTAGSGTTYKNYLYDEKGIRIGSEDYDENGKLLGYWQYEYSHDQKSITEYSYTCDGSLDMKCELGLDDYGNTISETWYFPNDLQCSKTDYEIVYDDSGCIDHMSVNVSDSSSESKKVSENAGEAEPVRTDIQFFYDGENRLIRKETKANGTLLSWEEYIYH